jgi:2'-5' RNA ligase
LRFTSLPPFRVPCSKRIRGGSDAQVRPRSEQRVPSDRERPAFKRLFVAVPLDERTRAAVAAVAERLRAGGLHGRFVRPENYHLTLAFLGNVSLDALPAAAEALERTARDAEATRIPLERAGAFPNERRARTVWLGPLAPPPGFVRLHRALLAQLVRSGFALESKPQPHVTLCRADGVPLPRLALSESLAVEAGALVLYSSLTLPEGPRYAPEHRAALARLSGAKE